MCFLALLKYNSDFALLPELRKNCTNTTEEVIRKGARVRGADVKGEGTYE